MEIDGTRTSAMPKSKVPFTKDTLEGDFHGYRREIWSRAAYDEEVNENLPKGSGRASAMLYFALVKPDKEAVVFGLFTGWELPETVEIMKKRSPRGRGPDPMGGAVDFHWSEPQWEGHEIETKCTLIDGGDCYGNTGFTLGEAVFEAICRGGLDAVWECLYKFLREQEEEKEE